MTRSADSTPDRLLIEGFPAARVSDSDLGYTLSFILQRDLRRARRRDGAIDQERLVRGIVEHFRQSHWHLYRPEIPAHSTESVGD
jgi:hypothetical protein